MIIKRSKISLLVFTLSILLVYPNCSSLPNRPFPPAVHQIDSDQKPISKPSKNKTYNREDWWANGVRYPLIQLLDFPRHFGNLMKKMGLTSPDESVNVNELGEVPDSTWFSNRIGMFPLSEKEFETLIPQIQRPSLEKPLTVLSAKSEGAAPGLLVKDSKNRIYLLKFDSTEYPQMATGAEIISTYIFRAIGYHVPNNFIVDIPSHKFVLSPKATTKNRYGKKVPFVQSIQQYLEDRTALVNGRYRALASQFLEGAPLGPFEYEGTRKDDPNDRIRHENRRELRALRIFSAWLNHTDARGPNSLDMFIKTQGQLGYVKHHLIDFGGTLGSWTLQPKIRYQGHAYGIDYNDIMLRVATLGTYTPHWETASSPSYPAAGFFEATNFYPPDWKTDYPNPAFDKMTLNDAHWGSKIVMKFSDRYIDIAVKKARYTDSRVEKYIAKILKARRDKIGKHYLTRTCPLSDFSLSDETLRFKNLMELRGWMKKPKYRAFIGNTQLPVENGKVRLPTPNTWKEETVTLSIELQSDDLKVDCNFFLKLFRKPDGVIQLIGIRWESHS